MNFKNKHKSCIILHGRPPENNEPLIINFEAIREAGAANFFTYSTPITRSPADTTGKTNFHILWYILPWTQCNT